MKKCLVILFVLLFSCVYAFSANTSQEKTVLVTAKVPDGTGVDDGEGIDLGGGVFLTIAIPRNNGVPASTISEYWESTYTSIGKDETVIAKLVDTDKTKNACEKFYLAYGLKGNPSKKVSVGIAATVDGWYSGKSGTGQDKATSSNMAISTVSKDPDETFIIASGTDTVTVEFDNGLVANEVLVGYSEISWDILTDNYPPAGDYSATVTITITSDGEASSSDGTL